MSLLKAVIAALKDLDAEGYGEHPAVRRLREAVHTEATITWWCMFCGQTGKGKNPPRTCPNCQAATRDPRSPIMLSELE